MDNNTVQVERYSTPQELIEVLGTHLGNQIINIKEKKSKGIDVKDEAINLHIGYYKNEPSDFFTEDLPHKVKTEINFNFNLQDIIIGLDEFLRGVYKIDLEEEIQANPLKLNCRAVHFPNETNFSVINFLEKRLSFAQLDLYDATFGSPVSFSKIDFQIAHFNKTIFRNTVKFDNIKSTRATFTEAVFESTVDFCKTIFQEADFSDAIFKSRVNFTDVTLNKADFSDTAFQDGASFINVTTENTLAFDNIKLKNKAYVVFENINYNFKEKRIIPHENSKIQTTNTDINTRIDFNNVFINKIDFRGSNVTGNGSINRINFTAKCKNYETATLFKHEEIKRDNIIKALEFKAIEKDLYKIELIDKKNKTIRERAEIVSIWLSKISNDHGQDWFRAVLFTIISGFIFCTIYALVKHFDLNAVIAFITNLMENPEQITFSDFFIPQQTFFEKFLIPLTKIYVPIDYSVITGNPEQLAGSGARDFIAILFYFIGKIAVSYGMVEIVQAFRKLK